MGILEKLKQIGQKEPQVDLLCIQQIRFGQFIENAKRLLALFDDGREKALGEYIFDRHYVVTLIDRVVEGLGMMVYDACVLVPESGKEFYYVYDRQTLTAKALLDSPPQGTVKHPPEAIPPNTPDAADPEYQLLFKALDWFNGKAYAKNETFDSTVTAFMEQLFFKVSLNLKSIGITVDTALFKPGQLASNLDISSEALLTKASGRL